MTVALFALLFACGSDPVPESPDEKPTDDAKEEVEEIDMAEPTLRWEQRVQISSADDGGMVATLERAHNTAKLVLSEGPSFHGLDGMYMADLNGDEVQEVVVMSLFTTGIGPQGAIPYLDARVMTYDGHALKRLKKVEKKISEAQDLKAVEKMLGVKLSMIGEP